MIGQESSYLKSLNKTLSDGGTKKTLEPLLKLANTRQKI